MPNLLFVSISFPPKNDPECLQTARYFTSIAQSKVFEIDVVTSARPTLFMPEDASLVRYLQGHRQLIELPLFESKVGNFLMRKAGLGNLLYPDSKMTFHWQWQKVLRNLTVRPDIIYSRSNPISSAVMARKLKRALGVPWVMHMSDPWALSPLKKMTPDDLTYERELLNEAEAVTFTTSGTLELYAKNYPSLRNRFHVFPNVFDPQDQKQHEPFSGSKWRIAYTGGLAGQRTLSFFTPALEKLKQNNPQALDRLEIVVAGPMDRSNRAYFESNTFSCLRHVGELSYQQAADLQRQSNALLVVDNPTTGDEAIFFPSKLLDYFLTGLPIIAVTPMGSVTRQILQSYRSVFFDHEDSGALCQFLENASNGIFPWSSVTPQRPPEEFNAEKNAKKLTALLLDTCRRKTI